MPEGINVYPNILELNDGKFLPRPFVDVLQFASRFENLEYLKPTVSRVLVILSPVYDPRYSIVSRANKLYQV